MPVAWFFHDEAWAMVKGLDPAARTDLNPARPIVERLVAAGVDLEVCGVTLAAKGWTADMLLPGVRVTPAALPRVIDLHRMGYVTLDLE